MFCPFISGLLLFNWLLVMLAPHLFYSFVETEHWRRDITESVGGDHIFFNAEFPIALNVYRYLLVRNLSLISLSGHTSVAHTELSYAPRVLQYRNILGSSKFSMLTVPFSFIFGTATVGVVNSMNTSSRK